jgi:ribonuclease HII
LFKKLEKSGVIELVAITAEELTALMKRRISLNEIEAMKIGELLRSLSEREPIETAFVDSPDPVAEKFEKRIRKYFDHHAPIVCEHFADKKYPVVSAASIIAKVVRDQLVEEIKKEFGIDFGTGYSHDPATIDFLKKNIRNPALQRHIRHRWSTAKNLKWEQMDLSEFF